MRVAHLIQRFSNLTETFIYDLVVALQAAEGDHGILTLERLEPNARPFSGPIRIVGQGRLERRLSGFLERGEDLGLPPASRYFALRRRLRTILREERPELVHAHFGPMGVLAAPVCEALQIPLIVHFYGFDAAELPASFYRDLWKRAARLISICEDMRGRLIALGASPERVEVVRVGKRLEAFPFAARRPPLRNFVSVGRLSPKKGHQTAIEAVARLAKGHPELRLEIYGEGSLRSELESLRDRLGVREQVSLRGSVPSQELPAIYRGADGFVLASRTSASGDREGTPAAILEAEACGLPILSTRHAGIPETIPEENWDLLAQEGNIDGLVRAWERLLALGEDELGTRARAGRAWVEERHDVERQAARMANIQRSVVEARAPQPERLRPRRTSRVYFHLEQLRGALEEFGQGLVPGGGRGLIVDLGCGSQPYRPLFERGHEYLGADLRENPAADLHIDAEGRVPLESGSVDVVLSTQVLEHVTDPQNYLEEAARLLKPGGRLLLSTHGVWRYHPDPTDYWRWTSAGLRRVVEAANFRVLEQRGLMGPLATATQLWQDASARFVPGPARPLYYFACQGLMATAERFTPVEERERDAAIYLLLAERVAETPNG